MDWGQVKEAGEALGAVAAGGGITGVVVRVWRTIRKSNDKRMREIAREEVSLAVKPIHQTLEQLRDEIEVAPQKTVNLLVQMRGLFRED